jgi:anti-anti-sigma factor
MQENPVTDQDQAGASVRDLGDSSPPSGWEAEDLLRIDAAETGTAVVLSLHGELDATTAPPLRQRLAEAVADERRLVVDATGLTFCGSSGLRLFLDVHRWAKERRGELRIVVRPGSSLERVVDVVGLNRVLPITSELATALG